MCREVGREDLERGRSLQVRMGGQVNRAHAALSEHSLDRVGCEIRADLEVRSGYGGRLFYRAEGYLRNH